MLCLSRLLVHIQKQFSNLQFKPLKGESGEQMALVLHAIFKAHIFILLTHSEPQLALSS